MRKPRSDSVLDSLPEDRQAMLVEWLLAGMPYHAVAALVAKEFGVKTSVAALSRFWSGACQQALIARRARAAGAASAVAEEAARHPGQFDAATIDAIKQKAFELLISPAAKPSDVKALAGLMLKARDQDLESRRVALLEQRARQAEEASGVVADKALTDEQKQSRLREIFRMS